MKICLLFLSLPFLGFSHFVKDQFLDKHHFPPLLEPARKGIPQGHLRPLGYQRGSDGKTKAVSKKARLQQFQQNCIAKRQPCRWADHYHPPAESKWGDKYLAETFGKLQLEVTLDAKTKNHSITPFKRFLKHYHYDDWKLLTGLPEPMKKDLTIPKSLQCPGQLKWLQYIQLLIQSGPNSSPIQSTSNHQLYCQLAGRSDFILIRDKDKGVFKLQDQGYPHSGIRASEMDVEQMNMFKYAQVAKVPWRWSSLFHGDCLFIPAHYLNQIRTYGRTVAVIFLFTPIADPPEDCEEVESVEDFGLESAETLWIFHNSNKHPNVDHWTVEKLEKYFTALFGDQDRVYKEQILRFFHSVIAHSAAELDAYNRIDRAEIGWIGRDFLARISPDFNWVVSFLNDKKLPKMRDEL